MFLLLTVKNVGIFKTQFLGIALFCVAYLAQFFVDLDKNKNAVIEESDDEDEYEESDEDSDDEVEDSEVSEFDDEDEFDNSYDNEDDVK